MPHSPTNYLDSQTLKDNGNLLSCDCQHVLVNSINFNYCLVFADHIPLSNIDFLHIVAIITFDGTRHQVHQIIQFRVTVVIIIAVRNGLEVNKAKEWVAGDVMIFAVHFAAHVHLHVSLHKKITPYNLDASLNVLEFMYW
jgi:hypothetical protein